MRFARRLSRRVVVVAVLSGVVGAALAILGARRAVREAVGDGIREEFMSSSRPECERAPETWVLRGPVDLRTYAYDPLTLRSSNPAAPPLDPALYRSLVDGGLQQDWSSGDSATLGHTILRVAPDGPCGLLQIEWSGRNLIAAGRKVLGWAFGGSVLAAILLGLLLVVVPLRRRTRQLGEAADRLGMSAPTALREDPETDELDAVLASLLAADARIRRDAETLRARSSALQRHLADVAHDVRTPLAAIQLSVEQALDAAGSGPAPELLADALRDCVYLDGLTENLRLASLLDDGWSPVRAGHIVDARAVVERVCARAAGLARRRGIAVEYALPDDAVELEAEPVAFERALGNIVDNAVAHGERGGHLAVTLGETGGAFHVAVLDDGPGVPPAELPRLGQRTFRSDDARRRDPRGSGLGLAITAELCVRCGWTLAFEVLEPRGLRVSIRGPMRAPAIHVSRC